MKISIIKTIIAFLFSLIISGCATHHTTSAGYKGSYAIANELKNTKLYLRGVFNWWETSETFRMFESDNDLYVATIELIADGQPYDFKIADESWSHFANCGQAEQANLVLNKDFILVCQQNSLNLIFEPPETGRYRFSLDLDQPFYPTLRISFVGQ